VKFYSSGMYVRLGFAIAVNVDPDVLVIDEVLAVGDERFQRKCLDRIRQFQDEGRTIVFVTHSPDQVRSVCNKALVLSDGRIVGHGPPGEAIRTFREHLLEAGGILGLGHGDDEPIVRELVSQPVEVIDAMHPIRITAVTSSHAGNGDRPYAVTGEPLTITLHYTSAEPTESASFVVEIRDKEETTLLRTVSGDLDAHLVIPAGQGSVSFHYASFPFLDGAYTVSAGVEQHTGGELSDWKEAAAKVEVMNPTKSVGLVSLPVCVSVEGP
jgi:ABC-2 type transport system ATP-binding protein